MTERAKVAANPSRAGSSPTGVGHAAPKAIFASIRKPSYPLFRLVLDLG